MQKQKILLVADHLTAELWPADLAPRYDCHTENTILDAVEYLKKSPDAQNTHVLVLSYGLPLLYPQRIEPEIPPELKAVDQFGRSTAFVKYIRDNNLIGADMPIYFATMTKMPGIIKELPDGATRSIALDSEVSLLSQLTRSAQSPDSVRRSR